MMNLDDFQWDEKLRSAARLITVLETDGVRPYETVTTLVSFEDLDEVPLGFGEVIFFQYTNVTDRYRSGRTPLAHVCCSKLQDVLAPPSFGQRFKVALHSVMSASQAVTVGGSIRAQFVQWKE